MQTYFSGVKSSQNENQSRTWAGYSGAAQELLRSEAVGTDGQLLILEPQVRAHSGQELVAAHRNAGERGRIHRAVPAIELRDHES